MKINNIRRKWKELLIVISVMMVLAVIGHSYYVWRFFQDGTIFTGPNDGLEQMLPMQQYIYQHVMSGKLFYDMDFGLGGDWYTDLSYYYSTSVVFFINMLLIRIGDVFLPFHTDTTVFWAKNAFYISILKSGAAMTFMWYYLRRLSLDRISSALGAFLFVTSTVYFRFTLYWSFFSDVFIFLPLLLLAIERFIQSGKKGLLITSTALILINNFYFAYHLVLIGTVYFIIRNLLTSPDDKLTRAQQWKGVIPSVIIGLMISAFSFYYGVSSFVNNERYPFDEQMKIFHDFTQHENVFYDNYLVVVLFVTIPALLSFKFYRSYWYRFFAVATIITLLFSLTPYIDSLFNGLSAPQKRWHYLITFFSSGLIAMYVRRFRELSMQNFILSMIPALIIVFMSDHYIYKSTNITWIYMVPLFLTAGIITLIYKKKWMVYLLIALIVITNIDVIRLHNRIDNYNSGINKNAKISYMTSNVYDSPLQRQIIGELMSGMKDGERIDHRTSKQDNTPMFQDFKGVSLYSSIFDGNLNDFYYDDLMINLKDESLSRYSGLQTRSNLESLFNIKYLIRKKGDTDIPQNFSEYKTIQDYVVYRNEKMIPFARIEKDVYNPKDIGSPIDREHAMIKGIVSNDIKTNAHIEKEHNWVEQSTMLTGNAAWTVENQSIHVDQPSGGVTVHLPKQFMKKKYKDVYLVMHVERTGTESNFQINVGGYANERMFASSHYRTHQDDLMYRLRVPENGRIPVAFTSGDYNFTLKGVYGEDYRTLEKKHNERPLKYTFSEEGRKMKFSFNEEVRDGYLVSPIIWRKGMKAYVDGVKTNVHRVNYVMTGVEVKKDTKEVTITYTPPNFMWMMMISLAGIIIGLWYTGLISRGVKRWIK